MGCRPYSGSNVQTGLDGYVQVQPPSWTGWKRPIWARLFADKGDQMGVVTGVGILGWEDPYCTKPSTLEWDEFSPEDQEKLLTTIERSWHGYFPLKPKD